METIKNENPNVDVREKHNVETISKLYDDDDFLYRVYAYIIEDGTFPGKIRIWTNSGLRQLFMDIEGVVRCFIEEDNLRVAEYELSVSPLYNYLQVKQRVSDKLDFYFSEIEKGKD